MVFPRNSGGVVLITVGPQEGKTTEGITRISKVDIDKFVDGINVNLDIYIKFGYNIPNVTTKLQTTIASKIDYITGINILSINVYVKGIDMDRR